MAGGDTGSEWLRTLRSAANARHHLLCFPPGGGSATAYRDLAQRFGAGVEVSAVQYPGRQDRLGDNLITDLITLADRIAHAVLAQDRKEPLSLFGHSMGATVAFETARELERAGRPVHHLFVSGRPAPAFEETKRLHLASDDALIDDLVLLASDPAPLEMLRAEPGLAELVLPAVRADYQAVETYRYQPGEPLRADIAALVSTEDPTMRPEQADEWRAHTSGGFDRATFPGGHFYLDEHGAQVAEFVGRHLGA
ncbi:alpha/beta fold hydrolase [Nocardia implantans]|uniref:Thioesterase TesA n=1 Tax=Nocardia implantans TaxID=3108168 RepID=A0ABU6ARB3_9NOCA|nr:MULTISPECIES: alpha/beta fold hydrolase [unclassified Nocardia]MBF6191460.1 thioesterase [Nocardia beijingensis]MEA3528233.1 alpha/beta fold hydrolase [Nocardia sp. CDC192]MEB3510017.1 alpha/beta fold hydrolase [Nocardia sp. CDC186]